mmetsp:Transcript_351/g.416  ORF Transcript_351/g.416 Transcript_351/m.416 type:complete len:638 (+) Transcript_351:100-2013(+)|eukprot:CAMPEP_0201546394 /NCGR_PEP_ID=MMETSP0173_2-20130828/2673_1 /ASSEMBLY_ACC=CAM_ASM_000268 /TAXON_ID=218659 /ORGANISM="Vexillifera sp., Strain DIVA3 564/2" /LENGTH=637 /DNA_ID=CAMNT_0047955031 /DNA_START=82 /DNA_END=1995 /DNA_ORIENTATION=+
MASDNNDMMPSTLPIDRAPCEDLLKRRFFYTPSFAIYGGTKGLYDFGPPGCALKANIINYWRQHFILEDNLLEIDGTCLTPEVVLQTSGHVEKFEDLMVRDIVTLECYRADHLLEDAMDALIEAERKKKTETASSSSSTSSPPLVLKYQQIRNAADDYSSQELGALLKEYNVKAPETGNDISEPFPFNLMFRTLIGPTGKAVGYLRPETAQGIFMNFSRLLEQNGGRMPFGGACIGQAFRNEISPRAGLLRVREFTLAEIEFFVDPQDKSHIRFASVAQTRVNLYPRKAQEDGNNAYLTMSVGEAVEKGLIANETLGYYIARCQLFLEAIGARKQYLRFRQHLANEMAHYACDCWDAELLTTYGWIECVGNADRSCYDLSVHQKATNTNQTYRKTYEEPVVRSIVDLQLNKGSIGRTFKGDARFVFAHLAKVGEGDAQETSADLKARFESGDRTITTAEGKTFTLEDGMITFKEVEKRIHGENVLPSVIEPSYGIGRILYALLEQSFYTREKDEQRGVLALKPIVAPVKCSILPLLSKSQFVDRCKPIQRMLTQNGISSKIDDSSTAIGKKYARTDEIGIPFGITIDHTTLENETVTLRDRDSMKQTRVPLENLVAELNDLVRENVTFQQVFDKYEK